MKKTLALSLIAISIISACSLDQELIKPKAKKRSYVSEQQDIELDGDMVVCGTRASGVLIELSRAIFLVTQAAVTRVNDYACGERECLNKVQRTDRYEKKAKIKKKIEHCIEQLERMVESLTALIVSLDE
jgi:hypothetical protein